MDRSILINKENKIKKNYIDKVPLIKIINDQQKEIIINEEAYKAYLELKEYLKTKGIEIDIVSAYRSVEEQEQIYNEYKEAFANIYVAPKEYSEHHTALAIDITIKIDGHYVTDEKELSKNLDKYEEIHKVLHNFGFILRYPKFKETKTKYPYMPWHIRYIGKYIANIITKNNLCLEEYKNTFSGVIILNKKKDYTSYDIVKILSHLFGIRKIGHTGTLDPLAEGVLVICIGNATKIEEIITSEDKEYIATVKVGIKTDTYDIEGKIIETQKVGEIKNLEKVLNSFKKNYLQEVPKYSAVKVNGKKLYEYARNNLDVELPKKEVTIKEMELIEQNDDTFKFRTVVSKGCYIRSLINDISKELNIPMTMTSLLRTRQGKSRIEDSYTLEDIKNNNYKIYSIEDIINFDTIVITNEDEFKVSNGVPIEDKWNISDKVLFKNKDNELLGIYQKKDNRLVTWKNFN